MSKDVNNTITFSVIIPVYNAEKTLRRCLDSILQQPHENAEILLINDGSTDSSDDICRAYQSADDRVVYLKKENGGVSSARNAGLEKARGEFVTFVDSDDYVSPQYFEILNEAAAGEGPDWIRFSNVLHRGDDAKPRIRGEADLNGEMPAVNEICEMICHKTINSPWDKVYKKILIDDLHLRFSEDISIGEDWAFNVAYACQVRHLCTISSELYHVCEDREDSLSRKPRTDTADQLNRAIELAMRQIQLSDLSERAKEMVTKAIHFYRLSIVYTEAKNMQRGNVPLFRRYQRIRKLCADENSKQCAYPESRFCKLVAAPVMLRFAPAIDWIAKTKMR